MALSPQQRRVLITGGTSGIGEETVLQLVRKGYDVTFTARDLKKAEETVKKVVEQNNNSCYSASYIQLELSSFDSINRFLEEVRHRDFDIVILNAGIMFPERSTTELGIETTFQVNYLAHFHLIHGLLQQRQDNHPMHIVTVTSILIKACRGLWSIPSSPNKWSKTFCVPPRKGKSGFKQYAMSKYALSWMAHQLNAYENVTSTAVHPGNVHTNVTGNMNPRLKRFLSIFKKTVIPLENTASNVVRSVEEEIRSNQWYCQDNVISIPNKMQDEPRSDSFKQFTEELLRTRGIQYHISYN